MEHQTSNIKYQTNRIEYGSFIMIIIIKRNYLVAQWWINVMRIGKNKH